MKSLPFVKNGLEKLRKILYNTPRILSRTRKTRRAAPAVEETMEQKAKKIGKFNIIDMIAVILILAVVVFAGIKLMNRGGGESGEAAMTKVTYTVKVEGVPSELYETCRAAPPGSAPALARKPVSA